MPRKKINNIKSEDLELAEEHLKLAEDLINNELKKCEQSNICSEKKKKNLLKAQFEIEKAESELEEENLK
ncbi:MAG: hypothetical protein QXG18_01340 [Candidatus Pacearchaeota archaeon]